MRRSTHQPESVYSTAGGPLLGHLGAESGRALSGPGRRDRSTRYITNHYSICGSFFLFYNLMIYFTVLVRTNVLGNAFPDLVPPGHKVVYDTLGKLIRDRKVSLKRRHDRDTA